MMRACFINAPLTQRIGQLFCKSSKDCKHDLEYSKIKVLINQRMKYMVILIVLFFALKT